MKKALLRFLLYPLVLIFIVSFSFAAKIHLKNGYTITGEIISSDDTSVTIRTPFMGIMKIERYKITNIEPPLEGSPEEKELTNEITEPETPEPKAQKPARGAVIPQQSKTKSAVQKPTIVDFLGTRREKKRISLYLSGGLTAIDGGDLNSVIRDTKQLVNDWNDFYLTDYSADWNEFERITNWKGELLINITSSFSFGLGVEYMNHKIQRGNIVLNYPDSGTAVWGSLDIKYSEIDDYSFEPEQQLTIIPITFNLYYFIPIGNIAEIFFKAGASYNIGRLKYNETYQSDNELQEDYYDSADTLLYTWISNRTEDGTYSYNVKSNEAGLQAGLGFDIKPFSFISLVVEGTYRYVDFKTWTGSMNDSLSWDEQYGWSYEELSTGSGNESRAWSGKLWYYEKYYSKIDKQCGFMSLHEEEPQREDIQNVRAAKININGFSLRAGIRISF